ncbi:MAG: response regulator transcription factor [Myxococcaceae bacterium]
MRRPNILIVDDDRFVRVTLSDCLTEVDCDITEATDGEQALSLVAASPPSLVLLDLVMPRLSGLEVLKHLRSMGYSRGILVISSMDVDALVKEALEAGADGFISKPFHPLEISTAVQNALRPVEARN